MNNKGTDMENLKSYVSNRVSCDKQQLENIVDTIQDDLNQIEDYVKKIRARKGYRVDSIKSIIELALRLRVLVELELVYGNNLSASTLIRKDLELLENDNE